MTLPKIDHTHDAAAASWVASANGHSDFSVQNLPFGIFSRSGAAPRFGVAIGDFVLDVSDAADAGLLPNTGGDALWSMSLNRLLASPAADRLKLRHLLFELLTDLRHQDAITPFLHAKQACEMHLPAAIGDYTDFYVGIHHANNVGALFRPDNPLLPNYNMCPSAIMAGRPRSVLPAYRWCDPWDSASRQTPICPS